MVRVFCGRGTRGAAFSSCSPLRHLLRGPVPLRPRRPLRARPRGLRTRRRGARRFCKLDSAGRRALAARLLKLAVLDQQKPVLADLVAARLVVRFHGLAGDGIDQLVLEAVPRAAVHLPEGDPFRGGRRGIERDRAGHERKLEKAIPVSTRQRTLQRKHEDAPNLGGDFEGVNGAPKVGSTRRGYPPAKRGSPPGGVLGGLVTLAQR